MAEISIILADSENLIRVGLRHLFERIPDFNIVAEATNEQELVEALAVQMPDIIIFDHNQRAYFPGDILDIIQQKSPKTNLLVISADGDKGRISKLLQSGINSYLTKKCSRDEIIDAVRATARGENFFCKNVMNYILEKSFGLSNYKTPAQSIPASVLSMREKEVVRLIAQGRIAKEIASELHLSIHTIYTHRKNIMKKLQLNSASELVLYAANQGLI